MSSVKEFIPTPFYKGIPKRKLRKIFLSLINNEFEKPSFHERISKSRSFDNDYPFLRRDQTESWSKNLKLDGYSNLRSPVSLHSKSLSYNFNSERQNPSVSGNIVAQLSDGKVSGRKQIGGEKRLPTLNDYMQKIKHKLMVNDELEIGRDEKFKLPQNLQNVQYNARKLGKECSMNNKEESNQVTLIQSYSSKINNKKSYNLNKKLGNFLVDPKQNKQISKKFDKNFSELKPMEKDNDRTCIKNIEGKNDFKNTIKFPTRFVYSSVKKLGKVNLESNTNLLEEKNKRGKEFMLYRSPVENNSVNTIREIKGMRDDIPVLFSNVRRVVLGINKVNDANSSKPLSRSRSENLSLQKIKTENKLGLIGDVSRMNEEHGTFNDKKILLFKQMEKSNVKQPPLEDKVMLSRLIPKIKFKRLSKSESWLKTKIDKKKSLNPSVQDITKLQKTIGSNYLPKKNEKLPSFGNLWKKQSDFLTEINSEPIREGRVFKNSSLYSTTDVWGESQESKGKSKINHQITQNSKLTTNLKDKSFIKWEKMNKESGEFLEKIRRKPSSDRNISVNKHDKYPVGKWKNRQQKPDYATVKKNHPLINDSNNTTQAFVSERGYSEHKFRKYNSNGGPIIKHLREKYSAEINSPFEIEKSSSSSRKKNYLRQNSKVNSSKNNLKFKPHEIYYFYPKEHLRYEFGLDLSTENINVPRSKSNLILYQKASFSKNGNKLKNYSKEYNNLNTEPNKIKFYSHENKNVEHPGRKKSNANGYAGIIKSERYNFNPISSTLVGSNRNTGLFKIGKYDQKENLNDYDILKPKNSNLYKYAEENKRSHNRIKLTPVSNQSITSKRKEMVTINPFHRYKNIYKPVNSSACEKVGRVSNHYKLIQNENIPAISLRENLISKFLKGKSDENSRGRSYDKHIPNIKNKYNSESFYLQKNSSSCYKTPKLIRPVSKINPYLDQKTRNKISKSHVSTKFSNKKLSKNNLSYKKSWTNRKSEVPYSISDDKETAFKNKPQQNLQGYREEEYLDEGTNVYKSSSYFIGKNERWSSIIKKDKFLSDLDTIKSLSRRENFSRIYGTKPNLNPNSKILVNSYDSIKTNSLSKRVIKDRKIKKQSNFNTFQNTTQNLRNSNNFLIPSSNSATMSKDSEEHTGNKKRNKKNYLSKFVKKDVVPQRSRLLFNRSLSEMFTKKYHLGVERKIEKEIHSVAAERDADTKQSNSKLRVQSKKAPVKRKSFTKNFTFSHDFEKTLKIKDGNNNNKIPQRNVNKNSPPYIKPTSTISQNAKTKSQYFSKTNKVLSRECFNITLLEDGASKLTINDSEKKNNLDKMNLLEMKLPNVTYKLDSLSKTRNGESFDKINSNNFFYNSFLKYKLNEEFRNKIVWDKNHIHSKSEFMEEKP